MVKLIVALDYTTASEAIAMANTLKTHIEWVKVGLELFTHEGPKIVQQLKTLGFKVMLDLKLFDIPNTIRGSVRSASLIGADLITLHIFGGEKMIKAAIAGTQDALTKRKNAPLLFGITVLTSMKQGDLPEYTENISSLIVALAIHGQKWGLDGLVCSGHEVSDIKLLCPSLACLTPGIRISYTEQDDQQRIMTPKEAVKAGSDFLVIGRPITQASEPIKVIDDIIASIS